MPSSKRSAFKGLKVLITSGPTSVPIDDVRVITNRSTGEMGRLLAAAFSGREADVTILEGAVSTVRPLPSGIKVKKFYFFDELALLLNKELSRPYELVIHAAAVSDFCLKKPFKGKLRSGGSLSLELRPAAKLIGEIKHRSPKCRLIGFKFVPDISAPSAMTRAKELIKTDACDLVVLNASDPRGYRARILCNDGTRTRAVNSKPDLVNLLLKCL